jgi:quinol monooxygenase YgiN
VKPNDGGSGTGELSIFARFHAKEGEEDVVSSLLGEEVRAAQGDLGCIAHKAYRSTGDRRLFYIHSRWVDEAAFEEHLKMQHTISFAEHIEPLLDHELQVTRTRLLEPAAVSPS